MSHERQAGRELDAEIAEKVMGWTNVHKRGGIWWGAFPGLVEAEGEGVTTFVPHFSWLIESAWLVVEAMRAKGHSINIECDDSGFVVRVRIFTPDPEWDGGGYFSSDKEASVCRDSAPLAICLAALATLESHNSLGSRGLVGGNPE